MPRWHHLAHYCCRLLVSKRQFTLTTYCKIDSKPTILVTLVLSPLLYMITLSLAPRHLNSATVSIVHEPHPYACSSRFVPCPLYILLPAQNGAGTFPILKLPNKIWTKQHTLYPTELMA